jgi:trehalose 6-phosphate synthase
MLRALRPDLRIGFFLHIPFPPEELFAQLPWRAPVLKGMLGANSIGFQTVYDQRNFRNACRRYLAAKTKRHEIIVDGRTTRAEAFPISIDTGAFADEAGSDSIAGLSESIREQMGRRRIILGVDRLDYTKGIGSRLRVLETVLDRDPDLARDIIFVQIAVPSRENVAGYAEMRQEIEQMAGRINGKHSRFGQQPVYYRYVGLPREELVAFYRAADVILVTPLRDGMNLVAKEYVACRVNGDGVLLLSEFAGAAQQLKGAVLVNPYDLDGTADAIERALRMPPAEQRRRMQPMRRILFTHDVYRWARDALNAIDAAP